MSQTPHLSLVSAIIININIMLGSGIFINTVILPQHTGALGAVAYGIGGLLFLPLILAFSQLLKDFPGGTFYDFGAAIHPVIGFTNSWTYFVGKLATAAIGIHVFVTLMQAINPAIAGYEPLVLDTLIVCLFVALNLFNLKTGRNINYIFIILKMIPILFVLFTALFLFNPCNFTVESFKWAGLPASMTFVIFAFAGFEASCSLSKQIINPEKNGPRAILISYLITLIILMSYQIGFFGMIGAAFCSLSGYREAFPVLIQQCIPGHEGIQWFLRVITLSGIAASSLGSSYGVIYSNFWNLHALAQQNYLIGSPLFLRKNSYGTPMACVIAAGIIILCYQWFSWGNIVPLQQISATGNLTAYTISVASFLVLCLRNKKHQILALLASLSCLILYSSIIVTGHTLGFEPLLMFFGIIGMGLVMFAGKKAFA